MTRRFLTAEDVRRRGGAEIVVEAGTIVTYQALELAERMGVAIRRGGAPYEEPPPDRGPDAETAARQLPNLPEPAEESGATTGVVVTAVGRNRPGVLAEITDVLRKRGADVHDLSQKTIEGFFHLILLVELPAGGGFTELKSDLECLGGPDDYVVRVMHERVFRFMHRI